MDVEIDAQEMEKVLKNPPVEARSEPPWKAYVDIGYINQQVISHAMTDTHTTRRSYRTRFIAHSGSGSGSGLPVVDGRLYWALMNKHFNSLSESTDEDKLCG